ncbi:hypothetical protein MMYC01_210478 [Madurella mycetomatis]|uniref:Uncharacterized protein n=1 Tax=Madurella mycetomatis TaxID=100816 RepID=A0A175VNH9_9PEZI|nr:hypothetical protein MMYC01_210478 [Madurella mycetomatis]
MANTDRRSVPAHLVEHGDDEQAGQRGYVKGTDFALPYFSRWSRMHERDIKEGRRAPSRTMPYTNGGPNHNKPLLTLANEVHDRHEAHGMRYHCPFAEARPARAKGEKQRPYTNHHALIMHANACLERLDHEFSSTGGLLSILPTPQGHDEEDLGNARNSLLGQWLAFTQAPQALVKAREKIWRRNGAVGDYIWESERGRREHARGIVPVDIVTRYYRLAGRGRNTLFVLLATKESARVRIEALKHENKRLRKGRDELMLAVGEDNAKLAARMHEQRMRAVKAEKRVEELMAEITALKGEA